MRRYLGVWLSLLVITAITTPLTVWLLTFGERASGQQLGRTWGPALSWGIVCVGITVYIWWRDRALNIGLIRGIEEFESLEGMRESIAHEYNAQDYFLKKTLTPDEFSEYEKIRGDSWMKSFQEAYGKRKGQGQQGAG
jgi:hypothetical protein